MKYTILLTALCCLLSGHSFAQNATVIGRVWLDHDGSCSVTSGDRVMNDIVIEGLDNQGNKYSVTSFWQNGYYQLSLVPGICTIRAVLPYNFPHLSFCQSTFNIVLATNQLDTIDFFVAPTSNCAQMMVDIASPGLNECGLSPYWLRYENLGTSTAQGVFIDLKMDTLSSLDSSGINYTSLGNGIYRFSLGNVGMGRDSGQVIKLLINHCNTVQGQTHCVRAEIFASNTCPDIWQGPVLDVQATEVGDSLLFTTRNIGHANMSMAAALHVIIDDVMYLPPVGPTLDTMNSDSLWVYVPEGSTCRLEVEQDPAMPKIAGGPYAWAAVEGANPDGQGQFKVGKLTQYYSDNSAPSIAYDCQQSALVLEYNDKKTETKGFGSRQYINKRVPVEYQINFQNLTLVTAQNIEIIDTLPEYYDLSSLLIGAASYPYYDLYFESGNVLHINFPAINLPSASQQPEESFGFINFYLDIQPNVAMETVIENRALVVVNYYDTIRTATAFNTIGDNFIHILSNENIGEQDAEINIFPNPLAADAAVLNVELKGIEYQHLEFELFDLLGQRVFLSEKADIGPLQIRIPALSSGVYVYRLLADGHAVGAGRLLLK